MVNMKASMDERMEINILDYRLRVMTISKSAIGKFTHSLLDVLFLKHYSNNNNYKEHHGFVSITATQEEYSIIMEEEAFNAFDLKSEGLVVNKETWLPLVASAGPMVTEHTTAGISKIANSVLIPLADQGISVYPLSTYRTDYVLIKETDFNKACEVLAENFRITKEGILDSLEIIVDPSRIKRTSHIDGHISRPITHSFDCNNKSTYCITSMDSESLRSQALIIIDMLLYAESDGSHTADGKQKYKGYFFNLSIINQDISLVFDVTLLHRFPPKVLFNNGEYWHIIKIDMPDDVGFREAGIVAQISEPIASAHISEYYISSFTCGHALVPVEQFQEVRGMLEKKRGEYKTSEACPQTSAA